MNGVAGDSRVIKTAKAAERGGHTATIVGVGNVDAPTETEIEGTRAILVPTFLTDLQQSGLWSGKKDDRPVWLLAEGALSRMAPVIQDLKPDLLHSHDMWGLRIGSAVSRRLAASGARVPWVHDLHEYVVGLTTVSDAIRLACMENERRYLRQADHLITVSDRLAAEVKDYYRLRHAPTVVYNAPDKLDVGEAAPDVRSAIGLPSDVPLVVYIGVAKKERGCETIVSAVAQLPAVHICFVSSSAYVASLKSQADTLGIGHRFHSLPYVSVSEVSSFIRTADVGIHGLIHYPNGEVAMPNKMFEYLQAGLPMVVSDVAEMKRFVEQHRIGTVFEAENVASCAAAIKDAIGSRNEYKNNITKKLHDEYSWGTQAKKLQIIYNSLLSRTAKKTITITDNIRGSSKKRGDVGIVSSAGPEVTCDFYLDPSFSEGRAGLLSNLLAKYQKIEIEGSPQWPTAMERRALRDLNVLREPKTKTANQASLLAELEASHLAADNMVSASELARGVAAARTAVSTISPEQAAEIKILKKKEAQLVQRVKDQKKQISQLEKRLEEASRPRGLFARLAKVAGR